ncbi:questin oxidase family protein [Amycolatopsis sp. OK19-0408]|uniref:Questin oxidase family protein n=1 Tax=Amycolatopsis iheyensis TaxID=2945988 RepID=A0A9X2NIY3_9PSEU|nr:questin oxidase family protein [Amycolatopsis iheyensis]MCR6488743.1 questin oxidase family protein [Amycolatopsis iheyensis]
MSDNESVLMEAYERFHATGPEWGGHHLSNHGPMAVEAMIRHGHGDTVHRWIDNYTKRLEEPPRGFDPVTEEDWQERLGDLKHVADWTTYLHREVAELPWREVLAKWWPRLMPGISGGTAHGAIRVGHVIHALLAAEAGPGPVDVKPYVTELADSLGYWAACFTPVAGDPTRRAGSLKPAEALAGVPSVPDQQKGVPYRLSQLPTTEGWQTALGGLRDADDPEQVPGVLTQLIDATVLRYLSYGHGHAVMLVHASTAPTAVMRTLPALPRELWIPSLDSAWQATAALTAACTPPDAAERENLGPHLNGPSTIEDTMALAIDQGDEHVIKFADTATETFTRTGERDALAAASRCAELITLTEEAGRAKFDGRQDK